MTYKAPLSGTYSISIASSRAIATGNFETVSNPDRKWYQIWKPKTIVREIYRYEHIMYDQTFKTLKLGDRVEIQIDRIAGEIPKGLE